MSLLAFFSDPIFIILVGVGIVVGGIIGLKLHPFLALLLGAFVVAIITPGSAIEHFALEKGSTPAAALELSTKNIGERIALSFGETCTKLGILIAMAAIIGKCLLESGAAERIVRSMLNITGLKKAPIALLVSSFFIGIPVFFDAVIFLMMPLAKALSIRTGKDYLLMVLVILAGSVMANSLVPPAPGPLFLAGAMNIPIGMMIIAGTLLGLITITAGYLYAVWANKRWSVPVRDSLDARVEDIKINSEKPDNQLPSLWFSLLPILIPLVLICANTYLSSFGAASNASSHSYFVNTLMKLVQFLGNKNIALASGAIAALILLAYQKKENKEGMSSFLQTALMSGGIILLIIAAGGSFGTMLQQTGISSRIAELTRGYQIALIPLAFFIAAVIRTAQGSATVALITVSGILSGMIGTEPLQFHQIYLGLAIGCGSKIMPWMNDSGFWVVCKMSNLTEREVLKTFSPMNIVMGITGLIFILLSAKLFPMIGT
ncbi:MAG: SLC13 family permease [Prolixibacteraceae bacterium]